MNPENREQVRERVPVAQEQADREFVPSAGLRERVLRMRGKAAKRGNDHEAGKSGTVS